MWWHVILFGLPFEAFRDLPGWYVCADPSCRRAEWEQLSAPAKDLAAQAREQNYQVFCGLFDDVQRTHQLFAISGIHPCRLVLQFRVGSHNQGWPDAEEAEVKAVYEQVMRIYRVRRFRPYFVDAAGYHCVFEGQITEAEARKVEALLETGGEWYASALGDTDTIVPILPRENELHLWRD